MSAATTPPAAITALGYAGLIPFIAGAIIPWLPLWWAPAGSLGFMGYSVAILSFLGGLQWGIALHPDADRQAQRVTVGVLPALAGALAFLLGSRWGATLLLVGFVLLLVWERRHNRSLMPTWYLPLRTRLTAGVAICHLAFLGQFVID